MTTRLPLILVCTATLTSALAAPPPRPPSRVAAAISQDQVRGWEAVGKLLLGQRMQLRARELCGPEVAFALAPEQAGSIVEAAVGQAQAEVAAQVAAPGWFEYQAARRVDRLLVGACDADTASFVASEIDSATSVPADELRAAKDLGKVPADKRAEISGQKREHQSLVNGVYSEFVGVLALAHEVGLACPATKPRIDELMARADALTQALAGVRVSATTVARAGSVEDARSIEQTREMAHSMITSYGGCDSPGFGYWREDTEQKVVALLEKHAGIPPLPLAWRQQ